jgi:hypothetical protein
LTFFYITAIVVLKSNTKKIKKQEHNMKKAVTTISAAILLLLLTTCSSGLFIGNEGVQGDMGGETTSSDHDMVYLYLAKSKQFNQAGTVSRLYKGFIEIENAAYVKNVQVFYTVEYNDESSDWEVIDAVYDQDMGYNKEMWYFETEKYYHEPGDFLNFKMAVRYEVNGEVFWDNNEEENYILGHYENVVFGRSLVMLRYVNAERKPGTAPQLVGMVTVKNVAFEKVITIVYTTDGWATADTYDIEFSGLHSDDETESWKFRFDLPEDSETVEFAISYTVDGFTTWDNNFLRNYSVHVPGHTW